jgi:hypothetical protein
MGSGSEMLIWLCGGKREWSIRASFWRKALSIFWVVEGRRIGKSDKRRIARFPTPQILP